MTKSPGCEARRSVRRVCVDAQCAGTISRGQHTVVAAAIQQAFDQPDRAHAGETSHKVAAQLRPRRPKLADVMNASEHDILTFMSFPRQRRIKRHSTNPTERPIKGVKRRADIVGVFPNEARIMRLIGSVQFEQNDEWQTSNQYMMGGFAQIDQEENDPKFGLVLSLLRAP